MDHIHGHHKTGNQEKNKIVSDDFLQVYTAWALQFYILQNWDTPKNVMGIITEFIAGHLNCLTIIIILFTYPPAFSDFMGTKHTKQNVRWRQ